MITKIIKEIKKQRVKEFKAFSIIEGFEKEIANCFTELFWFGKNKVTNVSAISVSASLYNEAINGFKLCIDFYIVDFEINNTIVQPQWELWWESDLCKKSKKYTYYIKIDELNTSLSFDCFNFKINLNENISC